MSCQQAGFHLSWTWPCLQTPWEAIWVRVREGSLVPLPAAAPVEERVGGSTAGPVWGPFPSHSLCPVERAHYCACFTEEDQGQSREL